MAMLKNIDSVDLSTFGGRLYYDIYSKYGSVNNFCKENNLHQKIIQGYVSNTNSPSIEKVLYFEKLGLDLDFLIKGKKQENEYQYSNDNYSINEPKNEYNSNDKIESLADNVIDNVVDFVDLLIIKSVVSAGHGAFADNKTKIVKYPKSFLKGIRKPAMINVSGDSMMPVIDDGDTLIFEQVHSAKNGNTIICTYDDICYVKKFIQTPKHLCLRSLNSKYNDMEIELSKLTIHGVVKKIIKNL